MKKAIIIGIITVAIMGGLIYVGFKHEDDIYRYYQYDVLHVKDNIEYQKNDYYKKQNYSFVQNTEDFIAKDKNHLKNIFYTIVNSGNSKFTFYCDDSYKTCTKDVVEFVKNKPYLSSLNDFVHPYNSFTDLTANYDKFGKITVKVNYLYSKEEITELDVLVKQIIDKNIKAKMDEKKKIKAIHDYIIKNSKYATDDYRKKHPDQSFNKATDLLKNKYGLCSAYADTMAIFLNELGFDNYKITNESHIWNLVKVKKKWLHLDLTWDDPVTKNGKDKLENMFFLIDSKQLKKLKVEKHNFDKEMFKEAN